MTNVPASPPPDEPKIVHPPGFRLRRGVNWFFLGLTYASYYLNRYNLSFASKRICDEFGFSNAQYGLISGSRHWAYAIGQFVNGLIADRLGGRLTMAIGGYGTALMNFLFGLGAYHKQFGPLLGTLGWFAAIRWIDGYFQSYGAPGMVKINTAWFARAERGRFAGIFGVMISLGRFVNNRLSPWLLAGFTIYHFHVDAGRWELVFFVPALVVAVITTLMLVITRNTPEEAGFPGAVPLEQIDGSADDAPLPLGYVFRTIVANRAVWFFAGAYFCTGFVRYGIDDWFPKYFQEIHNLELDSKPFQVVAFSIPFVAMAGSIISGYVSDLAFRGRRAPVAAFLYFSETLLLLLLIISKSQLLWIVCTALILVAFTCNSTHSILGTAAAMDAGGRKMAGFAAGFIDSFQYWGATLQGLMLGWMIDRFGWNSWVYGMAGFGALGGALMVFMMLTDMENRHRPAA